MEQLPPKHPALPAAFQSLIGRLVTELDVLADHRFEQRFNPL